MDDQALRTCICETGRELLENGLVARTWGNVSARADGGHYLVTPSGMDSVSYTHLHIIILIKTSVNPQNNSAHQTKICSSRTVFLLSLIHIWMRIFCGEAALEDTKMADRLTRFLLGAMKGDVCSILSLIHIYRRARAGNAACLGGMCL